jgi:hypothetical protein
VQNDTTNNESPFQRDREHQSISTNSSALVEDETSYVREFGVTLIALVSIEPFSVSERDGGDDESSRILAGEDQQDYIPPSNSELVLHSRWPLIRNPYRDVGFLAAISTLVTCACVYYAYNASISSDPFVDILWGSSDTTIFTVNLLTQLSILFLTELTQAVCKSLR